MESKYRIVATLVIVFVLASQLAAQTAADDERTIRSLEQKQVDLLLKGQVREMAEVWLPEFTVNNPFGDVVNGHAGPIRKQLLTYSAFTRDIEKILFRDGVAIVMGSETVVPSGESKDSGTTIKRRFTNIWVKTDGKWRMLARQASVSCIRN